MRTKDIIKEEANRGGGETSLNTKIEAKQDQIKFKKLEMPVIDSEDRESWFYREKHFFSVAPSERARKVGDRHSEYGRKRAELVSLSRKS